MLKKKYRLPAYFFRNNAQQRVQYARLVQAPIFSIYFYKSENNFSRFGVVIKNALCRTIVERNKLRRMIYSQLANQCVENFPPGYDCVLVVKKSFSKKDLEESMVIFKNAFK